MNTVASNDIEKNNRTVSDHIAKSDRRVILSHLLTAFAALLIGAIAGLLQTLVRSETIQLPGAIGYYQLLTAHGVLMALVFTTFFIIGFLHAVVSRTTGAYTGKIRMTAWIGFYAMLAGTVMNVILILMNKATVLYTFYVPLQASPWFYIGLVFIVVGSWISGAAIFRKYYLWKKANKSQPSPLLAFMAVATMILWIIATIGVAATVILQIIPWSFGWVDHINVLLSRTLFWYFGHPLVYFWLLPAYMCWYAIIPKIIGGKIFSDSLARLSFILFILFSIPVGFHHQLLESGIQPGWKFIQVTLTFMVVIPSLMTAFALFATFEMTGRQKGARGLFGWWKKLPWKDARFFALMMGMLIFIPAGTGGIINASNQLDQVVHNTLWVTGHFHITAASSVALTFFGISYWLIPHLTGRCLTPKLHKIANAQTWLWTIGMFFMSGAMHMVGLLGAPRRTAEYAYGENPVVSEWMGYMIAMAIGGTILFLGTLLLVYILVQLLFFAPKGEETFPVGEALEDNEHVPGILENWKVWIGIAAVLILFAYTVPIEHMIQHAPPGSPGFKLW